jgi:hypothetical protein
MQLETFIAETELPVKLNSAIVLFGDPLEISV